MISDFVYSQPVRIFFGAGKFAGLHDVLSELDGSRQRYLLDNIHDIQTMITCTGVDDFVENNFQIDRLFQVVEGTVERRN